MAKDYPIRVGHPILWQQLLPLLVLWIKSRVVQFKAMLARFELLEDLGLPILLAVLFGVDHDMHPVALVVHLACGHQVAAYGILLRQVSGEVHLLPFEDLLDVVGSGESKLTKMPALDEVELTVYVWLYLKFVTY
jgi:hypothetical protein